MVFRSLVTGTCSSSIYPRRLRLGAAALAIALTNAQSPAVAGPAPTNFAVQHGNAIIRVQAESSAPLPRPRPAEVAQSVSPVPLEESETPVEAGETAAPESDQPPGPDAADASSPAEADPSAPAESSAEEASEVAAAPLPRLRPKLSTSQAARYLAAEFHGFTPDFNFKAVLDQLEQGRYPGALTRAAEHDDPLVPKLTEWLVARQSGSGMSASKIINILQSHGGWPEPEKLFLRAEQAFHAFGPDAESVLAFYSLAEPRTIGGRLALAGALREAGRSTEAMAIVRELWRQWPLAASQAGAVLTRFGSSLTREDHLVRFRRLVLRERSSEALAQAELLGAGYASLARAVIAALDRKPEAWRLLRSAAPKFFFDPLYIFAEVRLLRRSGKPLEAARLLLQAGVNDELGGDGDVWWDERRDLSRMLLDRGTPDLAYRVVADARPEDEGDQVEAAFHAGWYALRFLHDPYLAEPHFRELHRLATIPRSESRASYWLGRTHEAQRKIDAARLDYGEAAEFGGTFYGQLAREKLGMATTGLERMPESSAVDRIRFANRDLVKAIRLLAAAGYVEHAPPFLRALGETVDTPGEVALLTALARRVGYPHAGTGAAAVAAQRGLRVASLSAPYLGVPTEVPLPGPVDRALVYAVVRQESAFDHTAVSHAGARGLMQLMPATARATARNARLPFSEQRLTTDPLYNATLGAHHIGELLGGLDRSYVLTFVGYNAGPGRALEWVRNYGDPRGGSVDPVDWIERIPFDETRDYVQKVMENLQAYRSRTGHPLSLSKDLIRGGPQG